MSTADAARQLTVPASPVQETGFAPLSIFEEPLPPAVTNAVPAGARLLRRAWKWLQGISGMRLLQVNSRRLRVTETVSLGEKRFVSIVEVDGLSLLIGGGSANVSVLKQLDEKAAESSFQNALSTAWADGRTP